MLPNEKERNVECEKDPKYRFLFHWTIHFLKYYSILITEKQFDVRK